MKFLFPDTKEILCELAVEGLPIRLFEIEEAAFDQAKQLTLLMKKALAECRADWVLPLDGDEFLTRASDSTVRTALERLPCSAPAQVSWRKPKKVIPLETETLRVAHFPLRTLDQATVKGLVAWPNSLANSSTRPDKHWNQQRLFNEILGGEANSPAWLTRFASTYAETADTESDPNAPAKLVRDPIVEPNSIRLRWPNPGTVTPLAAVSETAERLGGRLGELRRSEKS